MSCEIQKDCNLYVMFYYRNRLPASALYAETIKSGCMLQNAKDNWSVSFTEENGDVYVMQILKNNGMVNQLWRIDFSSDSISIRITRAQ